MLPMIEDQGGKDKGQEDETEGKQALWLQCREE